MLRFFPFGETFDARMGGRALGADEALCDVDEHYLTEVGLKKSLLEADPAYYFAGGEETLAAQWDVLELVLTDVAAKYPDKFSLAQEGSEWRFTNHLLGEETAFTFGDARTLGLEPLDFAGRQVQEDLVLVRGEGDAEFYGGQLCFANGWAIPDRIGKSFMTIHTRTPQATMPSVGAGHRLLQSIKAGRTLWRLSWNFKLTDQLDLTTKHKAAYKAHFAVRAPALTLEAAGLEVFIRIERQTFTRLPRSGDVLFGIHTYNSSLAEEAKDPERARRILNVVRSSPQGVKDYKAITPIEGVMTAFLESRCSNVDEASVGSLEGRVSP